MTWYWVRHGQSTWNAIDRMQGQELSPPLTDLGREQAAQAATVLAGHDVTTILTSPAMRTMETAEIIADHLDVEVQVEPLLLEKGLDESYPELLVRVQQVLQRDHPDGTVLVSHGDVIGLAVGLSSGTRPELPDNGAVLPVEAYRPTP